MTLKPLNHRILVRPTKAEQQTSFGIILSIENQEKPTTGDVVVGNDLVKEGDKVLFSKFGFDEVVIDKETLYIVSEQNILGLFE